MSEEKNKIEEMSIVVDDGAVKVPIKNLMGEEVGVFYFNPTDIGIVKRFNDVAEKFNSVIEPLQNININPDGTGETVADVAALEEAENRLYELVNYLFGANTASAFFGKVNPFSPVQGKFYAENVLNAVANYISAKFEAETKKVNERVLKYTHGYKTGKHKGGKK